MITSRGYPKEALRVEARECPAGEIRNGLSQRQRGIERLRTRQPHAKSSRFLAEQAIDIIKNLHMIAKETDGLEKNVFISQRGNFLECLFNGGSNPWPPAGALALKSKPPPGNFSNAICDQFRRMPSLVRVRIGSLAWPKARAGV